MKRKTAIEECIGDAAGHIDYGDEATPAKARREFRALMALMRLTAFAQGNLDKRVDWDKHNAKVDRTLATLRRLGLIPARKTT